MPVGTEVAAARHALSFAWLPLEAALVAFHDRGERAEVVVRSDGGAPESLSASIFFRTEDELEDWESMALARCGACVLDVGAGVGAHTLVLQRRGHRVTALEVLPQAVRIMGERGVKDARTATLFDLPPEPIYDTVLILMNGSMLAETLWGLDSLLERVRRMLRPGGVLLLDSTDLGEGDGDLAREGNRDPARESVCDPGWEGDADLPDGRYAGELHFQLSYGDLKGEVFPQLFVDPQTLEARAGPIGWETGIIWRGKDGRFLAELSPI